MTRSKTPETGLCPDWIYSPSSNVHIAKDLGWYTTYQPFRSHLTSLYTFGTPVPVLGIGTIKLRVKSTPGSFTIYGFSTIELHNVLHVPDYPCNVLGRPLCAIYQLSFDISDRGLALHRTHIAHCQHNCVLALAVLPPPGTSFGPSPFKAGVDWAVSVHWPHEERVRWQTAQANAALEHDPPRYEPGYTLKELEYMNERWGCEFRFLAQHRLKLSEERDRSEGRRIMRAVMEGREPKEKG